VKLKTNKNKTLFKIIAQDRSHRLLSDHQYIDRTNGRVCDERPFGDWIVSYLYSDKREQPNLIYRLLGSPWTSSFLGWVNYDFPFGQNLSGIQRFLRDNAVDPSECVASPKDLTSARMIFERQIRYWQCRPMANDDSAVICPADSRVIFGSLQNTSTLFLKGKFFDYKDLIGARKRRWLATFHNGDFAIFRLTPDKYHYNHTPVAGIVRDFYQHEGDYHSCNPRAVLSLAKPYSKNRRVHHRYRHRCSWRLKSRLGRHGGNRRTDDRRHRPAL
jgi:phosphatidylserine decarboxylase